MRNAFFVIYSICFLLFVLQERAPLLFKIREFGFLLFTPLTAFLLFILWRKRPPFWMYFSIGLGFLLCVSISNRIRFQYRKQQVLNLSDSHSQRLGKHFVVGFTNWSEMQILSSKGLISGIYLTSRNIENGTQEEIKNRLAMLQSERQKNHLPPLLITADQEGGMVSRLSPPLPYLPTIREYLDSDSNKSFQLIEKYAQIQSKSLKSLGVNVNFSPVVDIYDAESDHIDLHTQIRKRAISEDPQRVSQIALVYTKIYNQEQIIPTYKHFPGIGKVKTDTHFFTAEIPTPIPVLEKSDLLPFKELANSNYTAFIMLSHTKLHSLDSTYPCSFSKNVVQNLLRKQMGFQGILITDDISMGPSFYFGAKEASLLSLKAGVDLLLISYDTDLYYDVFFEIHQLVDSQGIENILSESEDRLKNIYQFLE